MSVTIDNLSLEISSNSKSAIEGIDALVRSLNTLKVASNNRFGLTNISNQIKGLDVALRSFSDSNISNLDKVINTISKLSSIEKVKISSSIANQLGELVRTASELGNVNFIALDKAVFSLSKLSSINSIKISSSISAQLNKLVETSNKLQGANFANLSALGSGLNSLSKVGDFKGLQSVFRQLDKLPTIEAKLNTINWNGLISKLVSLNMALNPLSININKLVGNINSFPSALSKVTNATRMLNRSTWNINNSYIGLWSRLRLIQSSVSGLTSFLANLIKSSNDYIESLSMFSVSMGEYADNAMRYAEAVSESMGIDPAEWLKTQGVLNTIITGFGVASDKAALMSKNLTQLGYDLSSLFNLNVDDAMAKLQSGIAGELEPLRRIGFDLSVAQMQAVALSLGIDKSVASMTQAEKAQLRYYMILNQVTIAQGDMARTLMQPANIMRILVAQIKQLGRAVGNLFVPALQAILPYLIAIVKFIREIVSLIGGIFGIKMPKPQKFEGVKVAAGNTGDLADNSERAGDGFKKAAKKAKELKTHLLGIDELNIISPDKPTDNLDDMRPLKGIGKGSGISGGFDVPIDDYVFNDGENPLKKKVDEIVNAMKEWLGITEEIKTWADLMNTRLGTIIKIVQGIGAAFAAWKVSNTIINAIDRIASFLGKIDLIKGTLYTELFKDITSFINGLNDAISNGSNFDNSLEMLKGFLGAVGVFAALKGRTEIGGAFKMLQGITELIKSIKDISEGQFDKATEAVRGITHIVMGIGLITKNYKLAIIASAIDDITTIVDKFIANWDKIKNGDFSGVANVETAILAISAIGKFLYALGAFSKLKDLFPQRKTIKDMTTVGETIEKAKPVFSETSKSILKMVGTVIGVAVAAVVLVGAIGLIIYGFRRIGEETKQLNNVILYAIEGLAIGIAAIAGFGLACKYLGQLIDGKEMLNIAKGASVLVGLSYALSYFISPIVDIIKSMTEIGIATRELNTVIWVALEGLAISSGAIALFTLAAEYLGNKGFKGLFKIAFGAAALIALAYVTNFFLDRVIVIIETLIKLAVKTQELNNVMDNVVKGLLIGVGAIAAFTAISFLLGSVGLAAGIAIGIGAVAIIALTEAVIYFLEQIVRIVDVLIELSGKLVDELLPNLQKVTDNFNDLMDGLGKFNQVLLAIGKVSITNSMVSIVSGVFNALGNLFSSIFGDPLDNLNQNIENSAPKIKNLSSKLSEIAPDLEQTSQGLDKYFNHIQQIDKVVKANTNSRVGAFEYATTRGIFSYFGSDGADALIEDLEKAAESTKKIQSSIDKVLPNLENISPKIEQYSQFMSNVNTALTKVKEGQQGILGRIGSYFSQDALSSLSDSIGRSGDSAKKLSNSLDNALKSLDGVQEKINTYISKLSEIQSAASKMGGKGVSAGGGTNIEIKVNVSLLKRGWSSVQAFIGTPSPIKVPVSLTKSGWSTIVDFIGSVPTITVPVALVKSGWSSVSSFVGPAPTITVKVNVDRSDIDRAERDLKRINEKRAKITSKVRPFAKGGYINANGSSGNWESVSMYANGTRDAGLHGSLFVAGEAGAEMVGHINGRTEVLNQSQIKVAMRSAVVAGMAQFTDYWKALNSQLAICSNAIINSILVSSNSLNTSIVESGYQNTSNSLSKTVSEDSYSSLNNISDNENLLSGMKTFIKDNIEPLLREIAADTKRQANKEEQTIVQIGTKTVSSVIEKQREADGYVFS